jgi:hypothetical protein
MSVPGCSFSVSKSRAELSAPFVFSLGGFVSVILWDVQLLPRLALDRDPATSAS